MNKQKPQSCYDFANHNNCGLMLTRLAVGLGIAVPVLILLEFHPKKWFPRFINEFSTALFYVKYYTIVSKRFQKTLYIEPFALQIFSASLAKKAAMYFAWSCLNKPACSDVYQFIRNMR
jgi:hypothetical protein